jgi:hypothetical protein
VDGTPVEHGNAGLYIGQIVQFVRRTGARVGPESPLLPESYREL